MPHERRADLVRQRVQGGTQRRDVNRVGSGIGRRAQQGVRGGFGKLRLARAPRPTVSRSMP